MAAPAPLVSIICVSYAQAEFVAQALDSVLAQTYRPIELLIVDDASPDESQATIRHWLLAARSEPTFQSLARVVYLPLSQNGGNCRAFNTALRQSTGQYVIDLAADDVLLPTRVARQIHAFATLPAHVGVVFSDAAFINQRSELLGTYYARDALGQLRRPVPHGDVYRYAIAKQFICSPTMLIRRQVLDALGGYDETLSYEDYDFWVRSARHWHYFFQDEILTYKRRLERSHGSGFYRRGANPHLVSTLRVCQKAFLLNQNRTEHQQLAISVRYHLRLSLFTENFALVAEYANLLRQLDNLHWVDRVCLALAHHQIPLHKWYVWWQRLRRG